MKAFIEAGAAGVHYEDQLASEKKCGHLGGKVLIPTAAHIRNLTAARLAADVMGVPTLVIARTDAEAAKLLTSDIDERIAPLSITMPVARSKVFYQVKNGLEPCIARANAYAPYCDLIWCETSKPDLSRPANSPKAFTRFIPAKSLRIIVRHLSTGRKTWTMRRLPSSSANLAPWATSSSFITLAGFHQLNYGMFELARGYKDRRWPPIRSFRKRNLQPKSTATPQHSISGSRHRLLRCGLRRNFRRHLIHHCHEGIDRARPVPPGRRITSEV